MQYVLESQNEYLNLYRTLQPIDEVARNHIKRASVLRLREAVCSSYEVNPFISPKASFRGNVKLSWQIEDENGTLIKVEGLQVSDTRKLLYFTASLPENHKFSCDPNLLFEELGFDRNWLDYNTFVKTADWESFRIEDTFRRSILAGDVKYVDAHHLDELVLKKDYVDWAKEKGIPLTLFILEEINMGQLSGSTCVKDILMFPVEKLPSSSLRALGNVTIAEAKKRAGESQVSVVLNSKIMNDFQAIFDKVKGAKPLKEDTKREHIERLFSKKVSLSKKLK